jgi:hypothetical protein
MYWITPPSLPAFLLALLAWTILSALIGLLWATVEAWMEKRLKYNP